MGFFLKEIESIIEHPRVATSMLIFALIATWGIDIWSQGRIIQVCPKYFTGSPINLLYSAEAQRKSAVLDSKQLKMVIKQQVVNSYRQGDKLACVSGHYEGVINDLLQLSSSAASY